MNMRKFGVVGAAMIVVACSSTSAMGQDQKRAYQLPAQDLKLALRTVARDAGLQLIADTDALQGKQSPPLNGDYTLQEALDALLQGSSLTAQLGKDIIYVRGRDAPPREAILNAAESDAIVITGSRIRGAPSSSPITVVTNDMMRDAGQQDLGEVARSLTQSYSGGQNPGIAIGSFAAGTSNLNSASSLNLRGLGADATLTLFNGHRLAFSGSNQAIDISAIPIDAVERIEVLTDGASALYGSDAVGGVANVILKKEYQGAALSARLGEATDGGNFEQQYSAVLGRRWAGGGLIATYDFSQNTAIWAGQRDYTAKLHPTSTLFPARTAHSGSLSLHQAIGSTFDLSVDALYNFRKHRVPAPFSTTSSFEVFGTDARARTDSWAVAPSLKYSGLAGWAIAAEASLGESRARYSTIAASGGVRLYDTHGCYCSRLLTLEVNADGPIVALPGGSARAAFGAGLRRNELDYSRHRTNFRPVVTPSEGFSDALESRYAFAELYVPLLGGAGGSPVERLALTGAIRYEDYRDMDAVLTPKLGLILAPSPDIAFKASWGRSFKAPTLYQQHQSQDVLLFDVDGFGSGYPAGATILYRSGGNPDLEPERASNWTGTITLTPRGLPGLTVELSGFHIDYSRRIVEPIASAAGILDGGPLDALVIRNPSQALIAEVIASSAFGLSNETDGDYDPSKVVAIIDNRFLNVAKQRIRGVDLAIEQSFDLGQEETLGLSAAASYLESRQQLVAGGVMVDRAGMIFNPPHWRARGGLSWRRRTISVSAHLSHIGGVRDDRSALAEWIGGQTPLDLTLRYRFGETSDGQAAFEVIASARNILDDKPRLIRTSATYFTPYDSTNYSPVGRMLSLQAVKRW